MTRRWIFLIRVLGGIGLAIAGYSAGSILSPDITRTLEERLTDADVLPAVIQYLFLTRFLVSISFALFGFAFGYLLAPAVLRPLQAIYDEVRDVPPTQVLGATFGLAIGLVLGALAAVPLSFLNDPFGQYLPFIVAAVMAYLGAAIVGGNPGAYLGLLRPVLSERVLDEPEQAQYILLDTSVIIDGRIADVADTGFIDKTLLVPRFVLAELQQVADSPDTLRRNRGRRGLEILNQLQQSDIVDVEITDLDVPGMNDVDRKLVRLGEQLSSPIMTNDFNLNRVAEIQGVRVLNLNELANSLKTLLLPGEELEVRIIQEGKEHDQGVGYLEDGTMVVVEHGKPHIDETLPVTVTRVLQTVAGRMIFATPSGD